MKRRFMLLLSLIAVVMPVRAASAQTTYVMDQKKSLVWWQLDPHFGHLWATTCPNDPSWQPGEGHSGHYKIDYKKRPKVKLTNESAGVFPLFPRDTVRANCRTAVSGSFIAQDIKRFTQTRGVVTVLIDSIVNGSDARDLFAKKYIYSSGKYPTVKFAIDSLTSVNISGDTVNAVAVGTFTMRGVDKPTRVQVQGVTVPEGMRIRGLFAIPAKEMQERFGVSKAILSMGVGAKLWDTLFMGFDLIMTPQR